MISYSRGCAVKRQRTTGRPVLGAAAGIVLFFSLWGTLYAERIVSLDASVDRSKVDVQDTITLTVTAHTENVKTLPKPQLPNLSEFTITGERTSSSLSVSIVNGKRTQKREQGYIYTLKPLKTGTFTIGAVTIPYKGTTYSTSPITVTVIEGYASDEPEDYILDDGTPLDIDKLRKDIFILVEPGESTVYEGQQIVLSYKLYSRLDIDSIALKSAPEFSGFYKEDIYNATKLENKREMLDEQPYDTTLLRKVAIYPIKPGSNTLDPLILESTVIVKSDDLFGLFGRPFTFQIRSNDVSIQVNPLPRMEGAGTFSHIVGDLSVEIVGRDRTVAAGESTTCYVILKSTGNLGAINPPQLSLSKRGRVYLSETKSDRVEEKQSLYLTKRYEYTIIPEESGQLEVDAADIVYFDPGSKQYVAADLEPLRLNVTGKSIVDDTPITESRARRREGSFSFIKGDARRLKSREISLLGNRYYYMYHALLLLWIGVFFLFKFKRESMKQNKELFLKVKALRTARTLLSEAEQLLQKGDLREAIQQIHLALTTYIAHKNGKTPQDITVKSLSAITGDELRLEDSEKEDIADIIDRCMLYIFSSRRLKDEGNVRDIYMNTKDLIEKLERR
ncbi:MAG TPA: BatD family protein [Spirochaetota bacterium]|nr:BatD family protein [Spirochaetota bacterium]